MTEKQKEFFKLLGIDPNKEFKIKEIDNWTFKLSEEELEDNYLMLYQKLGYNEYELANYLETWTIFSNILSGLYKPYLVKESKKIGELKCKDFAGCEGCPLHVINCCIFKDNIDTSSTLFECLYKNLEVFKDQKLYDLIKSRLDKDDV